MLFIYFRVFTLSQKKTNRNCVLQLKLFTYCSLMLPIICIALVLLRLRHATGGAQVIVDVRAEHLNMKLRFFTAFR